MKLISWKIQNNVGKINEIVQWEQISNFNENFPTFSFLAFGASYENTKLTKNLDNLACWEAWSWNFSVG